MKCPAENKISKWSVSAQVESIKWDPHHENSFVVRYHYCDVDDEQHDDG